MIYLHVSGEGWKEFEITDKQVLATVQRLATVQGLATVQRLAKTKL